MNESQLVAVIEPTLARHELELDALDIVPAGRRTVLRVTVDGDGPEGRGPTLDDIAVASRDLSAALDDSTATGEAPYILEVSSRGVNRPLTLPRHWRRNAGRLVKVTADDGTFLARIVAADEDGVDLAVEADPTAGRASGEDTPVRWAYGSITKARVQVELKRSGHQED